MIECLCVSSIRPCCDLMFQTRAFHDRIKLLIFKARDGNVGCCCFTEVVHMRYCSPRRQDFNQSKHYLAYSESSGLLGLGNGRPEGSPVLGRAAALLGS